MHHIQSHRSTTTLTKFVVTACSAITTTLLLAGTASAQVVVPKDGYLCCNLRLNGTWASDANSPRSGDRILKPGAKVIGLAYGSTQVDVEIDGTKISIGNDYSRNIPMDQFAKRWILPTNPATALATWTPRTQQAVKAGRVVNGMNRKQVLTSLGWPTATSTPNIDDPVWSYTASNGSAYKVVFNEAWLVKAVDTDAATKKLVVLP
jgi:hypothetical protein